MKDRIRAVSIALQKQKEIKATKEEFTDRVKFIKYLLSIPFIYGMLIPFVFLHIMVEIYHRIGFFLYEIPYVNWREYIIIDRHRSKSISTIQKTNCIYCSYINGLIGYIREISARTEQFWCPIKHKKDPKDVHSRYQNFIGSDDVQQFQTIREKLRYLWSS